MALAKCIAKDIVQDAAAFEYAKALLRQKSVGVTGFGCAAEVEDAGRVWDLTAESEPVTLRRFVRLVCVGVAAVP